jgi:hypothetical protein
MSTIVTRAQLQTPLWYNCIVNKHELTRSTEYKLYATGYYSLSNGRYYVALPKDETITDVVKSKYNLL